MKPLRIAVCDDEQAECELMEKYIREWAACKAYQALVLSFSGGEALLQAFSRRASTWCFSTFRCRERTV